MREDRISPGAFNDDESENDRDDAYWQSTILNLVLEEAPHQLTKDELTRALVGGRPGFSESDAIERAIRELGRAGLLHEAEPMISPTRASRFFARLYRH